MENENFDVIDMGETEGEEVLTEEDSEIKEKKTLTKSVLSKRVNYAGAKFTQKVSFAIAALSLILFYVISFNANLDTKAKIAGVVPLLVGGYAFYNLYFKLSRKIVKYYNDIMNGKYHIVSDRIVKINKTGEEPKERFSLVCEKCGEHGISRRDYADSVFRDNDEVYVVVMDDEKLNKFVYRCYSPAMFKLPAHAVD